MDSAIEFQDLLQIMSFGANARTAIAEFCAETLDDLARLPKKVLHTSIDNLHKSLTNLVVARRVRLNATKCTLLHALRMHYNNRINCNAISEAANIQALTMADIHITHRLYYLHPGCPKHLHNPYNM